MRSNVSDVLPSAVKRSLAEFGGDLATARRKRGLTVLAVAQRMGVAKNTYLRAEKGDPKVGLDEYACQGDIERCCAFRGELAYDRTKYWHERRRA